MDASPIECCLNPTRSVMDEPTKGGERVVWEYHTVTLTRVPGYGFGIAVSGGRDNPHFGNGDPAIAISDVLKAGPAEGKLQINDRVMSANGVPLENVDYATAVQVLRDCGATVNLVIKRRVVLPSTGSESHTLRITLTKNKKKDDFGIILGCRIYVKEVTNKNLMEKAGGLQEGDVIAKINNAPTDTMTLKEAKKLMENCKEKLQLVIRREPARTAVDNLQRVPSQNLYESTISPNAKYETNSPPNFIDISDTRPYSNQNLYVQPPTRAAENYRSPPPPPDPRNLHDDKNNLIRMTSRNRGPLLDISLSQLDQPATPLLHGHGHNRLPISATNEEEEPPPRPPLPRVEDGSAQSATPSRDPISHSSDFYNSRRDLYDEDPLARRNKQLFLPDPRYISFQKDGSVGIRLTGGNDVGIFVTAVQPGSPASLQGLQPGDKILKVNNMDMKDVTREEAVLYLLSLQDRIDLIVQYRKDEYDAIAANQRGDSFYIRTHFNYDNNSKGEMSFRVGDIFRVVDTLHNGVVGSWQVYRIGRNNQETQKGIIPNKNRAEELAAEQQNLSKKDSSSENRGSFFKRRSARRSKSLTDSMSKYPAYERVSLRHPGFTRPVILFGPLSDYARDKLMKDYPEKFASPQLDTQMEETPKSQKSSCIVRLSAIKEIIDRGKHAVIDITPNAVDRLNYAQFYPIVMFMRADNKHVIKELRGRSTKSSSKSSKKLFDLAVKLEKNWSHIFTATITLTSADTWYRKVRESIEKQQQQAIWMSETKPEEPITDDFLFPMTSRLSYASSPESDLDLAVDSHHRGLFDTDASLFGERRLVKASSDPSIATQEEVGLPSYHGPPPYTASPYQRQPLQYNSLKKNFEDRLYEEQIGDAPKRHNEEGRPDERHFSQLSSVDENRNERSDYLSQGRSKNDLYGPPSMNDHYGSRMNGDLPGRLEGGDSMNIASGNYINTNKSLSIDRNDIKQYTMQGGYESSSYSSDSYNKFPNSVQDEIKLKERYNQQMMQNRSLHDPYRFTRSTAQPIKALGNEKVKPNDMTSKYRADYKPVPPPKSPNYKPVPPPKPKNYRSPTSTGHPMDSYWSRDDVPPPLPMSKQSEGHNMVNHHGRGGDFPRHSSSSSAAHYMKSYSSPEPGQHFNSVGNPGEQYQHERYNSLKGKFDDDSAGFDSGQGSSLDRNYDSQTYISKQISPSNRGYYYNVPPPRDLNFHTREPSGLDLSNRENRGSAFELYKKPDSRSPPGLSPLTVNIDSLKTDSSSSHSPSPKENCQEEEEVKQVEVLNLEDGDIDLDSHTVIAMANGRFSHEGGVLASEETGVSIVIPAGAIPEGEDQEIYFKVCQDKKMLPPLDKSKGETLLSPLVMCGPHGLKFAIPVELHLPHCASVNPDSWSFALKSSDTPSGIPTQWENISLSSLAKESQSRVNASSVSILIDHF